MSGGLLLRERDVKRAVKRLLAGVNYWVYDLSQERPSHQTPGLPDLFAMHLTKGAVWVETKAPGGRLSDAQEIFADRCAQSGVGYLCCSSLEPVHAYLARVGLIAHPAAG